MSQELKWELERIWNERGVKSATHFLMWVTTKDGEPYWKEGHLATLRHRKPRRKVSRRSSKETQNATV